MSRSREKLEEEYKKEMRKYTRKRRYFRNLGVDPDELENKYKRWRIAKLHVRDSTDFYQARMDKLEADAKLWRDWKDNE